MPFSLSHTLVNTLSRTKKQKSLTQCETSPQIDQMQDFFGSVRRSLVFRPPGDEDNQENQPPFPGALADKITSCIRKSRALIKPSSSPPPPTAADTPPPISWRKGQLIGRGAFGTVYMGMNLDSGELLAVKQVLGF